MSPESLVTHWRQQAAAYDADGQPGARLLERVASELEAALAASGAALVSPNDGARLSGYSPDHIGRMIRQGQIPNYGTKHRPKVRLGDLPRRPARLTSAHSGDRMGAQ